ncbi:3',5'-bisphosphate nucleotidase-like protein [Bimuria novae-zelandiae CBS 107.79]|uniref:3',5'-bisphosphate nucleotidase-like protein n=1 Tax=Bimuria novae-zelandiae CBS 107.79 TaxID=1447943 RepID=A0A6A5UZN3_9PLEO|nr:3',5'-bisphosphate nucleotidase-like protein [Bimuria novae-zelandiae CBS 107.79]
MFASTHPQYANELAAALHIVHAASILTKSVLRALQNNVAAETKADDSPVTIADFAAQALIISALHKLYPEDAFLGEESAAQLRENPALADRVWQLVQQSAQSGDVQQVLQHENRNAPAASVFPASLEDMLNAIDRGTNADLKGRVWVMDPVDGTATFMTGNQYAVCLCLLVDGVQQVGVIGCPNLKLDPSNLGAIKVHEELVDESGLGVVLSAVRGQGTHVWRMLPDRLGESCKIDVRKGDGGKESSGLNFIEVTLGKTSLSQAEHEAVAEVLGAEWPGTVIWSQQMKYVALTLGATDVMLRLPLDKSRYTHVWDHAGGQLLFQEVGGIIRDIDGGSIDFSHGRRILGDKNYGMIATQPWAFDRVNEAVKQVLARRT